MLEIEVKSEVLKELVGVVVALCEEAKFEFTKDGLKASVVDTSHVAMAKVHLTSKAFEKYACEGTVELGIDMNKLKDVLKIAGGENLNITLPEKDEKKSQRLVFKVGPLTRYMSTVDLSALTDAKLPKLDLPAKVVVDLEEVNRAIHAASSITDSISITASDEHFRMEAEGDTESIELDLAKGSEALKEYKVKDAVRSVYPLDYMETLLKSVNTSPVELRLGQEFPVEIHFEMAGGNGKGMFILAPRIEDG